MSYVAIRDSIVTRLNTVSDIGVVSNFRRAITAYEGFEEAFVTTIGNQQQIRGWSVAWESGSYDPMGWTETGQRMRGPQTFVVRGYMSAQDSRQTDREFSALTREVIMALTTVGATLTPRQAWIPVELRINGFMEFDSPGFGGVMIHYCEIALVIEDEEVVSA